MYNGIIRASNRAKANAFVQEYARISNKKSDKKLREDKVKNAKELRSLQKMPRQEVEAEFTRNELDQAINELSLGKAAGADEVSPEMMKKTKSKARNKLLYLFNRCWQEGTCPQAWRDAVIIPLLKKEKDPERVDSYRPISLTSVVGKTLERMLKNRLSWWLESKSAIHGNQAGFRQGRDTTDQALRVTQTISDGFQAKPSKRSIMTQFDYSKAYDTVCREILIRKMLVIGIPTRFIEFIKGWLVNRRATVRFQDAKSKMRVFRTGLPQGAVLSPLLFVVFINDLLVELGDEELVCAFADDVAVVRSHNSKMMIQAMAQRDVEIVERWSSDNRMILNHDKCTCSFFSTDSNEASWQPLVKIGNISMKVESAPTFLGVKYDRLLHFGEHADYIVNKVKQRNYIIRSLGGTSWGWKRASVRSIFIALQRSVLEYAGPAWKPWISKSHMASIERAQRQAARIITRVVSSTPVEAVLKEASLEPMTRRLDMQGFKRAIKWTTMEAGDNRYVLARRQCNLRLKRSDWRTDYVSKLTEEQPLQQPQYGAAITGWNPVPPWCRYLAAEMKYAKTNKEQTVEQQRDQANIAIEDAGEADVELYTDGSFKPEDGTGGTGVVIYKRDERGENHIFEAWNRHLSYGGSSRSCELMAMEQALQWLSRRNEWHKAKIVTDSCSLMMALENQSEYRPELREINKYLREMKQQNKVVTIIWIPSHCGHEGNEVADKEAEAGRIGANEEGIIRMNIADKLRSVISKQMPETQGMHERTNKVYKCKLKKEEESMSKADRTQLSRFRTGHHPAIGSYQCRIGIRQDALCRLCSEEEETMEHLWMVCPAITNARNRFGVGWDLEEMTSKPSSALQLVMFIINQLEE